MAHNETNDNSLVYLTVQVYHSVMTKYVPKRIHFSVDGMNARTQLAALDHNANVGREQSKTSKGELMYKMQYSRQKGDYVAKKIYTQKTYVYVHKLMKNVIEHASGQVAVPALPQRPKLPISRRERPDKQAVVDKLKSRIAKNTAEDTDSDTSS
eukprot:scpid52216/ scgid3849/ 